MSSWPVVLLPQDGVNTINVPLSTNTQLYDASRIVTKNTSKSYYFNVSTFTATNSIKLPGPKFQSNQDRMTYILGQNAYLGTNYK